MSLLDNSNTVQTQQTAQTQNQQTQGSAQSAGTGVQSNTYAPWQSNLQNLASGYITNMLSQGPQMQNQQQQLDYANLQFDRLEAPRLAQTYGPGSPVINSSRQIMNLGMLANLGQQANANNLNVYNAAMNYAMNPTGSLTSSTQGTTQNQNVASNQNTMTNALTKQTTTDTGGLLDVVGSTIGNLAGAFLS